MPDEAARALLETAFPALAERGYEQSSPEDTVYNCIAHAIGDTADWWWPVEPEGRWPESVPRERTLDAFAAMFAAFGFDPVDSADPVPGVTKVAVYASDGSPTHAARQLGDGRWTSKLGANVDITHSLEGLEGQIYGTVNLILGRPDS